jgi:hypothetical protein
VLDALLDMPNHTLRDSARQYERFMAFVVGISEH